MGGKYERRVISKKRACLLHKSSKKDSYFYAANVDYLRKTNLLIFIL